MIVGSGYTYLQEWLPHVGAARRRATGCADFVGLGRMVLSYPELPADVLARPAAQAQVDLPHVQRLHDRAAHRPRLRLLSRSTRSTRKHPDAARLKETKDAPGVTVARSTRRPAQAPPDARRRHRLLSLFSIVGFALYGLPFFYDFFVQELAGRGSR